jgi:hypothetical protein
MSNTAKSEQVLGDLKTLCNLLDEYDTELYSGRQMNKALGDLERNKPTVPQKPRGAFVKSIMEIHWALWLLFWNVVGPYWFLIVLPKNVIRHRKAIKIYKKATAEYPLLLDDWETEHAKVKADLKKQCEVIAIIHLKILNNDIIDDPYNDPDFEFKSAMHPIRAFYSYLKNGRVKTLGEAIDRFEDMERKAKRDHDDAVARQAQIEIARQSARRQDEHMREIESISRDHMRAAEATAKYSKESADELERIRRGW